MNEYAASPDPVPGNKFAAANPPSVDATASVKSTGGLPADQVFCYRGTLIGQPDASAVIGTITATDKDAAEKLLAAMQLRVEDLVSGGLPGEKKLSQRDFYTFNQQLLALVKSGLPLNEGLRLLSTDLRHGRLASAVKRILQEMEAGKSLPEALSQSAETFPPEYARLVEAGVKANNLSGVLMNFGLHVELTSRLREALRQALSYPLAVFGALLLVWCFLGWYVVPKLSVFSIETARDEPFFQSSIQSNNWTVQLYLALRIAPMVALGITALMLVACLVLRAMQHRKGGLNLRDIAAQRLPFVGPALRLALVAQWCDALRVGIDSALDLPAAIRLAGDVVGSPALATDGRAMVEVLNSGRDLSAMRCKMLPPSLPGIVELGMKQNNLPGTLETLSQAYSRQTEHRTAAIPAIMSPVLLIVLALTIGLTIFLMLLPLFIELQFFGGYFLG